MTQMEAKVAGTKKPDLRARLVALVLSHLMCEAGDVTDDSRLQDLGADELDVVEIQVAAEEEFNINIPDEDLANAGGYEGITFGGLLAIVEAEIARKTT